MADDQTLTPAHRSVIAILLVSAFVVILNETAMNVALTRIMADMHVTERLAQWLTTAFMLTMAVVIPVTGWLLNRLPTRRVFLLAMLLFSLGTLICAVAPWFAVLLGGRIVQASGTAIMMPLLMTTIMQLVPPAHRGAVMGNVSLVISVAPAVGPSMSGALLQLGSWRFIFAVVLPIALTMLVVGSRKLTNVGTGEPAPLDVASVPLTMIGFGVLVFGLSLIGDVHMPFWAPWLALGIGIAGLLAFGARQLYLIRSQGSPLLDLRTLQHTRFTIALLMMALAMMALFGTIITLPLVLQKAYHLPPLQVGLMLLPGGVAMGVLSPVVGRLFDKVGPRPLVVPAGVVVMACFFTLSTLSLATPWWLIMSLHIAMSVAFACTFTPLFTVSLGSLPKHLYSHGSALVGTAQQLAGAIGTALFVTVLSSQAATAQAAGASAESALLVGTHWAFLGAGAVWTAAVVAGWFLKKPVDMSDPMTAH